MQGWIFLLLAGIFEIGFTTAMRMSDGFRRWPYTVVFCICAICSFGLVTLASRSMSAAISYAVWTGMGAAGTLIIAACYFHDRLTSLQIFFVCLIVISVIGLSASR